MVTTGHVQDKPDTLTYISYVTYVSHTGFPSCRPTDIKALKISMCHKINW